MKHLAINEVGTFLGVTSERLVVNHDSKVVKEIPLSRLKTISILKNGVSFSSNLILECVARGIKFFVFDSFGKNVACIAGGQMHAVTTLRKKQFKFIESDESAILAQKIILAKIKNQRAVLLYYKKYLVKKDDPYFVNFIPRLDNGISKIDNIIGILKKEKMIARKDWRAALMGYEGEAAKAYWGILIESKYFPASFKERYGRNASDPVNQMLNYGYAILSTFIWHCCINAGLEVFAGILHVDRPGKPSLILDLMEEYRPWIVDKVVIKLRMQISNHDQLTAKLRKSLVEEIYKQLTKTISYRGKNLTVETFIQRQVYRVCGQIYGECNYRPYVFKW